MCLLERKVLRNILRSMIKRFLTNKGHISEEEIILKCDNETITESSVLAEMFVQLTFEIKGKCHEIGSNV